jgi:hypothetical protein
MPVKRRLNGYSALRRPVSVRVTVDAWTLTSASSSFGTGRSTSATRSTSGGPYRSWTTALIPSRPPADRALCDVWPHGRRGRPDHPTILADELRRKFAASHTFAFSDAWPIGTMSRTGDPLRPCS